MSGRSNARTDLIDQVEKCVTKKADRMKKTRKWFKMYWELYMYYEVVRSIMERP